MHEALIVSRDSGIVTITLNRPDRLNALNKTLMNELISELRGLMKADDVRALILTGSGRAFCAGADLKARSTEVDPQDPEGMIRDYALPAYWLLRELPFPTIAAINGPCVGGAVGFALACDLVVAARSAYFLLAYINIGHCTDMGVSWFLPRRIGEARASELLMLGDKLSAERAEAWGLIQQCVDDDKLASTSYLLASRLAQGPTKAYLAIRSLVRSSSRLGLSEQIEAERHHMSLLRATEDYREGALAFVERRPAIFKGR